MPVTNIKSTDHFKAVCQSAGSTLIVVDFTAKWCGPCKRIAPVFSALSEKYSDVLFYKVDVDECEDIAQDYKIRAMPTFMAMKFGQPLGKLEGADEGRLEELIQCASLDPDY